MVNTAALEAVKTGNKALKARSKKNKDKDGEAIAKRIDKMTKTFDDLFKKDAELTKAREALKSGIEAHNKALTSAADDARKLVSEIGPLAKTEPQPRIYITLGPQLGNVANTPKQEPI